MANKSIRCMSRNRPLTFVVLLVYILRDMYCFRVGNIRWSLNRLSRPVVKDAKRRAFSSETILPAPAASSAVSADNTGSLFRDRFSVAPMMEYTDRFQRKFFRLLSRKAVLYTEMVTCNALAHTKQPERFMAADFENENPLVLQVGASDVAIARAGVEVAVRFGYREINLNVGCPSESVSDKGCFGAVLMRKPKLVGEICDQISQLTGVRATVKCRIGVDDEESYEHLLNFVDTVHRVGGVQHFIVHARKAVLGGIFSPDQNRRIPPLKYEFVHRLKKERPHLSITINGGILSIAQSLEQLALGVDGVMIGRAAVNDPYHFASVDSSLYNTSDPSLSQREVLVRYAEYAREEEKTFRDAKARRGLRSALVKPLMHLFHDQRGSRAYRVALSDPKLLSSDMPIDVIINRAVEFESRNQDPSL